MVLQNVTLVILGRNESGGLSVRKVVNNPDVPSKAGQPSIGPYARRLLSVKEVMAKTGLTKNKAQAERRERPLLYLADFPGQPPLESLLEQRKAA